MNESQPKAYSMRSEYLTYLIRQALHEGQWSSFYYNQELADSLFAHMTVMTHNCDWSIIQADNQTSHNLVIEIGTPSEEGFSIDEIALLAWSIGAILTRRNWFEIPEDEFDRSLRDKPGASGLRIYDDRWADEFNNPTPFAGNSVEHEMFRDLEPWIMWTDLTIRLTYDGAFDESYGTNEQHYLKLFETDIDFNRVDPSRFEANAFIERLESNFEFRQQGK